MKIQKNISKYTKSIQRAPTVPPKKERGTIIKQNPSTSPYQIHKIYNRGRAQSYKQFGPRPMITKKSKFNSLIGKLFVIEHPVPFLPGRPKKTQRSCPLNLFPFPTHKGPAPTWECLLCFRLGRDGFPIPALSLFRVYEIFLLPNPNYHSPSHQGSAQWVFFANPRVNVNALWW